MKAIRDPVHGYVEIDGAGLALLDTPQLQRLRRVKQLGVAHLVYPGANHTRFEHSLGTYHLARRLCAQLGVGEPEIPVAALVHDVAHGPLSHVTEGLMKTYLRRDHAHRVAEVLRKGELRDVLERFGLDYRLVASTVTGEGRHGQLVCGDLDVDRMDYLARDAHYTGVGFGLADHEQLLRSLTFHENRMVVEERGLHAAESVMVARFLMHPTVYYHHTSRIGEAMLSRSIGAYIDGGGATAQEVLAMDDYRLFVALSSAGGYPGEMAGRVMRRDLFKRAVYRPLRSLPPEVARRGQKPRRLGADVAEQAGVSDEYVLVDMVQPPESTEISAAVLREGAALPLERASPLVATLRQSHMESWFFGIYAPQEHVEAVRRACESVMELPPPPEQSRIGGGAGWGAGSRGFDKMR